MAEKDIVFSSTIKYTGIFSFKDFYIFCHEWLTEETGMDPLKEEKYEEKLAGDLKEIVIEWVGEKKITDYFRFDTKVKFTIRALKEVEIMQGGIKVKTNEGSVKVKVDGILVRDYEGKFDRTAHRKFTRGVYEKWVIPSRIEEFETKVASDCDEFLGQAKAYLDLEGKK